MGYSQKLPSGRWRARWRDDAGWHSKTFSTKREATAFLGRIDADRAEGSYVSPALGRQTFAAWFEHWHGTRRDLRSSSRARNESYARNHLLPRWGDVELAAITQPDVRAWITGVVDKGLAPATVEKIFQIFAKAMQAAVDAGLIARAPTNGIELPRKEQHEMRFLAPPEIERLAVAMTPRYRALVYLGAYGGFRIGEMAALTVGSIDRFAGAAIVRSTLVEVHGRVEVGPPKTKAAMRAVKLPGFVMGELEQHIATFVEGGSDAFLFQGAQGGVLRVNGWRQRHWRPAVRRAGLEPLRIHDLRHTAISLWIAANVDPKVVASRAGHRSVVTVFDRYGHLYPSREDELVAKLEEMRTPLPRLRIAGE